LASPQISISLIEPPPCAILQSIDCSDNRERPRVLGQCAADQGSGGEAGGVGGTDGSAEGSGSAVTLSIEFEASGDISDFTEGRKDLIAQVFQGFLLQSGITDATVLVTVSAGSVTVAITINYEGEAPDSASLAAASPLLSASLLTVANVQVTSPVRVAVTVDQRGGSSTSVGAIVGACVGVVVVLTAVFVWFKYKRGKNHSGPDFFHA